MDFQQTFFEIFQLPEAYHLDVDQLSSSYLELQKRIHPDNFSSATDTEKRHSLQWATHVNEAFTTLKSPLQRAIYMLEQRGLSIAHNPNLEPAFLMSQIELREELDDISETAAEEIDAALSRLDWSKSSVKETLSSLEGSFAVQFDVELAAAEQTTYKMQFMNKLLVAADQLEEQLLDY